MATQITPKGTLSFNVDSITGGISGMTPSALAFDFTLPARYHDERQASAATPAAVTLGVVGWTNVTWVGFKNHSATAGENIIVSMPPTLIAGGTDDGAQAGASVPATLTAAGYFRRISSAGTSQSKTWAVGDIAIYLGTSGTYLQLRPKQMRLNPGWTAGPFRLNGDGDSYYFWSESGTPDLGKLAVGACA